MNAINGLCHGWDGGILYHYGIDVANNLARYALRHANGSRLAAQAYLEELALECPDWEWRIFAQAIGWLPVFSYTSA